MEIRNIGLEVSNPKEACQDDNCPFHGTLKCRGRILTGIVVSSRMQKTVNVEWEWKNYLRKYERYEKRRSRVKAHNPSCINANEGDIVKIMECRPLSKTKNFVVVEVLGREKGFEQRMQAEEESKVRKEVKKPEDNKDNAKKPNKEQKE
ncbi:30S ribosomal protein S17 [Candidatus Woesearchaeota archaeon]|nr:30S ribosomal protein S17 [Candidatus Woesearchaeota archaeon]